MDVRDSTPTDQAACHELQARGQERKRSEYARHLKGPTKPFALEQPADIPRVEALIEPPLGPSTRCQDLQESAAARVSSQSHVSNILDQRCPGGEVGVVRPQGLPSALDRCAEQPRGRRGEVGLGRSNAERLLARSLTLHAAMRADLPENESLRLNESGTDGPVVGRRRHWTCAPLPEGL